MLDGRRLPLPAGSWLRARSRPSTIRRARLWRAWSRPRPGPRPGNTRRPRYPGRSGSAISPAVPIAL